MKIGVFDDQAFSLGGLVEFLVGRDEDHAALADAVQLKGGRQLNSVIGAKLVLIGEGRGVAQEGGRQLQDGVPAGQMLAEPRQEG